MKYNMAINSDLIGLEAWKILSWITFHLRSLYNNDLISRFFVYHPSLRLFSVHRQGDQHKLKKKNTIMGEFWLTNGGVDWVFIAPHDDAKSLCAFVD